jgi:hypothetical protein
VPACCCGSGIQRGLDASSARRSGAYWIHAPKTIVALDEDEAQKLAAFITGKPYIVRYPVTTPAKARFQQVDG